MEWKQIELLMPALDYYENISHIYSWGCFEIILTYKISYREVYHVAENTIPNKVFSVIRTQVFFIAYWYVELNYQWPILLK